MTAPKASIEELQYRYSVLGQSAIQIAKEFGYSCAVPVHIRLRQAGIANHGGNRKITTEELRQLYADGMSPQEIADQFGVARASIYRRLRLENIPLRTDPMLEIPLTDQQKEICFGGLLGDIYGTITPSGNAYLKIAHSPKQTEYVEWKHQMLQPLVTNIGYYKKHTEFVTKTCPQFVPLIRSFYVDGKKIVPDDLSPLTPTALAVWFMDDGSIERRWRRFHFATCSFSDEDNYRLVDYLHSTYGIRSSLVWVGYSRVSGKHYRNIVVSAKSYELMRAILEPHIIPSLRYKLGC